MKTLIRSLLFVLLIAPVWRSLSRFANRCGELLAAQIEWAMFRAGLIAYISTPSTPSTLTNLIPYMYEGLDVVSRELVGFIPAVNRDSSAEQAALNQTINVPVVGAIVGGDIAPNVTAPDDGEFTPANVTLAITKSRYWPIRWQAEEQRAVRQTGLMGTVQGDRFAQALRAAVNEVEADLAALNIYASRAYGTFNTAPFGTAGDLSDMAQSLKILDDNGAPGDRRAVFGSNAIANIRGKQSVLFKVNEAGTADLLRRGIIGDIMGAMVHNSSGVQADRTAGTGASATTNNAGYAIGATTITLASAGTGTIIAGDIVTFAGDANKYLIKTGDADVSNGGTIVLQEPGLRQAIPAAATAITVTAATDRNMVFSRSAIALVTRAPAMPEGGDAATDVMTITDPVSGLSFQVAEYKQYRQIRYELGLAWGVKMVAPRHAMVLIG